MPEPPLACVLDLEQVFQVLGKAALLMSMNVHTDIREVDIGNPILDKFLKLSALLNSDMGTYNPLGSKATALSVHIRQDSMMDEAQLYHNLFCQNFLKFSEKGSQFGITYLVEKWSQGINAWASVKEKFSNARAVNDEVTTELNRARMRAHQVKTACDVALIIGSAIAPIHIITNTVLGTGYSIGCKLAANTSDARDAKLYGFTASNALNNYANLKQDHFDDAVNTKSQVIKQKFYDQAKELADRNAARLEQKIAQFRAQNGGNFTGAQKKILNSLSNSAVKAGEELDKAQAALNAKAPKTFTNLNVIKNAPTWKDAAKPIGARVASIGIGLFFAWDDITQSIEEFRTEPGSR